MIRLIGAVLVVLILTFAGASSFAAQTSATNPPSNHNTQNERHPHIHRAINQLEHTKTILQKDAARDFEGHRAQAVKLIDEAIVQLNAALKSDIK